jgi:hypothetical protein
MGIQISNITAAKLRRITRNNVKGRNFRDAVRAVRQLMRTRRRLDRQLKRIGARA